VARKEGEKGEVRGTVERKGKGPILKFRKGLADQVTREHKIWGRGGGGGKRKGGG